MIAAGADVVVVGGGPAGAACAIALARGGARCLLLERHASPPWKPGEVLSSEALVPLRALGVWERLPADAYLRASGTVSRWGTPEPAERSSIRNAYGGALLVHRADLECLLLEAARDAGVHVVAPANVRRASRTARNGEWTLDVDVGGRDMQIPAPLVVEATGRGGSPTGHGLRSSTDTLTALIAYPARGATDRDLRFLLDTVPDGWWYSAPLPGDLAVVALLTDADLFRHDSASRESFFLRNFEASALLRERFGTRPSLRDTRVVSARSTMRRELFGQRWVAVGDAAATYDPLLGQGVPAALERGLALGRLLTTASFETAAGCYADAERAAYVDYLRAHDAMYGRVDAWPGAPFWARRAGRRTSVPAR